MKRVRSGSRRKASTTLRSRRRKSPAPGGMTTGASADRMSYSSFVPTRRHSPAPERSRGTP